MRQFRGSDEVHLALQNKKLDCIVQIYNTLCMYILVCKRCCMAAFCRIESMFHSSRTFFFFFHCKRKCIWFYIHSCWPFIEARCFSFIDLPLAEQEGFLLTTETQINQPLNQINSHLKWVVSLNTPKMSTYTQFE